jgi:hypothetical protein
MELFDTLAVELASIDRHLSRRRFLKIVVYASVPMHLTLNKGDLEFIRKVASTLIPGDALALTGIDVVANLDHILQRGSAEHRAKIMRLLTWSRRLSFLYGGEQVAHRARTSRFVLAQKMSKALSALCLVSFWGDERSLPLIEQPEIGAKR